MSPENVRPADLGWEGLIEKFSPVLNEIKKRLRLFILLFLAFAILGFVYYEQIINFSLRIFRFEGVNIAFTSPFQFINLAFSSALAVGLIAALPLALYQIFSFLRPALKKREFRIIMRLMPLAFFFSVSGFFSGVG